MKFLLFFLRWTKNLAADSVFSRQTNNIKAYYGHNFCLPVHPHNSSQKISITFSTGDRGLLDSREKYRTLKLVWM
jgi:hypothetical protein